MRLNSSEIEKKIKGLLNQAIDSGEETACQVAVFQEDELIVNIAVGENITTETLMPIFSVGKGIMSTAFHMIVQSGLIGYNDKVADYWPEFGCNGKEDIRVWHILSHRSGLHHLPKCTSNEMANWNLMCNKMAAATPSNTPGIICNYQPITFAWLVGELASRVIGKPFNEFIEEEIIKPLGLEKSLYFGTNAQAESNLISLDDTSVYDSAGEWMVDFMNNPVIRKAFIPSANGVANAYAIAKHYQGILQGKFISKDILKIATTLCLHDSDVRKKDALGFGYGYGLFSGDKNNRGKVFGHKGAVGGIGYADKENNIALGFIRNKVPSKEFATFPVRHKISQAIGVDII